MREVVIASPVRTPVGKFGEALRAVEVAELSALVIGEVVRRSGIGPAQIDGEQSNGMGVASTRGLCHISNV